MRQERHTYSARQRTLVITFATAEDAETWDLLDDEQVADLLHHLLATPDIEVVRS